MERRTLGDTGIEVSRLCLGVLPIGPLQLGLSPTEGASIVREALDRGITFLDTAESYGTYPHIEPALKGYRGRVTVASKSMATSYEGMRKAIEVALEKLRLDVIDIFHIHAADASPSVFREREGALKCLVRAKEDGLIRATGIATHNVKTVKAAASRADIDVVFPLLNLTGIGVLEGNREDMVKAVSLVHSRRKGVYAMKVLGGGNLVPSIREAFSFVIGLKCVDSVAVGMVSHAEVKINVGLFEGVEWPTEVLEAAQRVKRLLIRSDCIGCGTCVEACHSQALRLVDGKACVNPERCVLCGYCAPLCPEFAIRVV